MSWHGWLSNIRDTSSEQRATEFADQLARSNLEWERQKYAAAQKKEADEREAERQEREKTPPMDRGAGIPSAFISSTEKELRLANVSTLERPRRLVQPGEAVDPIAVMVGFLKCVEVVQKIEGLKKRRTRKVNDALVNLNTPWREPPKFPFDHAPWHEWLLQSAPEGVARESSFELGPMPLPPPWRLDQAAFTSPEDLLQHLETDWLEEADQWVQKTSIEIQVAEFMTGTLREKELREQQDEEFRRRLPPPPIPLSAAPYVLWNSLPREVYRNDPLAPTLRRHGYFVAYTVLRAPRPNPNGNLVYIRTNVDYIPPLPAGKTPRRRTDGRFGPAEMSRYAQWHQVGEWHAAFIPMMRKDGMPHKNEHSSLQDDIAWYIPDFMRHFRPCGDDAYYLSPELVQALIAAWKVDYGRFQNFMKKYPKFVGQPFNAVAQAKLSLDLLKRYPLSPRDIIETLASFQRNILEVRGWNSYVRCRLWLRGYEERLNKPPMLPAADARDPHVRRWTRGVFTDDIEVAQRYAQYGVPVFHVEVVNPGFKPPADHFVPEGPVYIPQLLELRYVKEAWNDMRMLPHVRAVQEDIDLRGGQQNPTRNPIEEDHPAPLDYGIQHADNDVRMEDDVRQQDDIVMGDDFLPPPPTPAQAGTAPAGLPPPPQMVSAPAAPAPSPPPVTDPSPALLPLAPDPSLPISSQQPIKRKVVDYSDVDMTSIRGDAGKAESSRGGKRKRDGKAKNSRDTGDKKRKTNKSNANERDPSVLQQRFPYNRRRDGLPALPEWWPRPWNPAAEQVRLTLGRDEERMKLLKDAPDFPVDLSANPGRELLIPIMEHLVGFAGEERKRSNMIASWIRLRPHRMRVLATQPVREVTTYNARNWRNILRKVIPAEKDLEWGLQLGLRQEQEPARIVVDDDDEHERLEVEMACEPSISEASAITISAASSTTASAPLSTAATTEASSSDSEQEHWEDFDDDDDIDMTRVNPDGSAIAVVSQYFEPQIGGQRTDDGELLAVEDERYLYEPSGWRWKKLGNQRGLREFTWYAEDGAGDDGVLEFKLFGAAQREEYEDYAQWWDYMGGRILYFLDHDGIRKGGDIAGERLTRPLRLFHLDGGRRPVYDFNTKEKPVRIRLWPAQSFRVPLKVPHDALGAVGSRTRNKKFALPDNEYEKVYPNAPRPGSNPSPQTLAAQMTASAPSASTSSTWASQVPPPAPSPATTTSAAATSSSSSTSAAASSAVKPETAVANVGGAHDHEEIVDGSDACVALSVSASPTATSMSSAAPQAAQPAAAAAVSAPTPLYDLLQPKGPMYYNDREMPAFADTQDANYYWPNAAWRTLIIWDMAELTFRTALFALDDCLRRTYPWCKQLNTETAVQRQSMLCAIWDDSSFVPDGPSPLTATDWRARQDSVRAFHRVVSTWPRAALPSPPAAFEDEADFLAFEKQVWHVYTQTYADYFFREPPVPMQHPGVVPWSE